MRSIHRKVVFSILLAAALSAGMAVSEWRQPPRAAGPPLLQEERGPGPGPDRRRLAGHYDADILRVVDGDTVEARVTVWFGQEVTTRVRLAGINAPEIAGACGEERRRAVAARDRLAALVEGRRIRLTALSGDKYFGRVVAELRLADGSEAGQRMIAEGLAAPYEGRRRARWCGLGGG